MPLSDQAIVQVATGSTGGTDASTMFVSFPVPAQAGNAVIIFTTTTSVSLTDVPVANPSGHPTLNELTAFTSSPPFHANTPYVVSWGAILLADTSTWQFDWAKSSDGTPLVAGTAWVAVELVGLVPLYAGTVGSPPVAPWEPTGGGIWFYNDGVTTVANTAAGTSAGSVYEVISFASFGAWVPSSRPPAVVSFAESTTVGWGEWAALAPNVRTTNTSTANVGLDVAYKTVYGPGQFDCLATYGQAPAGIGVIKDVFISDFIGPGRVRSSLTAQVMSG